MMDRKLAIRIRIRPRTLGAFKLAQPIRVSEILARRRSVIEIRDADEAILIYEAIGWWMLLLDQAKGNKGGHWRAATRIQTLLRFQVTPETVARWPMPASV
jgi:hypothetical protein